MAITKLMPEQILFDNNGTRGPIAKLLCKQNIVALFARLHAQER